MPFPKIARTAFTAARLVVVAGLIGASLAQAQVAPTDAERRCAESVQGKVAWNQQGNRQWNPDNLSRLCRGSPDAAATVRCFEAEIRSHNDWSRAIAACAGKSVTAVTPATPATPPVAVIPTAPQSKPINQYTYLGTHNAIASHAYGFVFQNSQRYDVSTQLDGGARLLEIDIVHDTPDDKGVAGVYVCHCGEAAHSYSSAEMTRAKDKKSKVPLPFWSGPARYIRFHTILSAVDKWLVANKNEIVFVVTENQSATPAQFDAEVDQARLSTGVYVKPAQQAAWPTRQELILSNKRLVILSADGVDLAGSRYANTKDLVRWGGYLTPKTHGSKNEYREAAGDTNKFVLVGSFNTALTDAVTARLHNDYAELAQKKAEWAANGSRGFPSAIQFNQIQVGEALRFVNELNGPSYQVQAKVPSDPAGNWIVNASADIGTAFVTAGDAIVTAAKGVNTFVEGEKTAAGQRAIKFNNQAGYVAKMTVLYFVNQSVGGAVVPFPKVLETPNISLGFTRPLVVPADAVSSMPITVTVEGVAVFKNPVLTINVPASFAGELCFKAWGTIFNAQGGKCD